MRVTSRLHFPLWASVFIGSTGMLIFGVQPLLYGAYVHAGRISEAGLGFLASIEIAAVAVGSTLGILASRRVPLAAIGLAGIALLAFANLGMEGLPLYIARLTAGLGSGLTVVLAARAIAAERNVNAASGLFMFLQAASQYLILQYFSLGRDAPSASSVQMAMSIAAFVAVLALPAVPARFAQAECEDDEAAAGGAPPPRGFLALGATGLFLGAVVGIWAYLGLWLETRGASSAQVAPMLTASMVGQMAGALIAIAIGTGGNSGMRVIWLSGLLLATTAAMYFAGAGGMLIWALVVTFGVIWMAATPALAGFLVQVDPSRRALPFAASAQLAGIAILPTFAGEYFAEAGMDYVILAFAMVLVASLALIVAALRLSRGADAAVNALAQQSS